MARIMDLSEDSFIHARYLGRAMQYLNFIRDIQEDLTLGRQYLPYDEMRSLGIRNLTMEEAAGKREQFNQFI